jgi:predicted pyridoxine 5'-phosphate oxidase superfamily flavin-nucleotide-binding protein
MASDFEEVVTTRQRLRELTQVPSSRAQAKVIAHIDDICRRFIAASPFLLVASRGADGRLDISPKGDPPGFVAVLDEKTLAIPDRPGNHRFDTLRVGGKARIVQDTALQARLAVAGKPPNFVLVVTVEEAFMHCSKCMIRSMLWNAEGWPDRSKVPSLAEAIVAHAKPLETTPEVQAFITRHDQHLY